MAEAKLKTPVRLLMERVGGASRWARTDEDRRLFELVLEECRRSLGEERAHIEGAWEDGQSGIKHQSGKQFYESLYGKGA